MKDKFLFCLFFSKCTSFKLRNTKRLPKTIANIVITIRTGSLFKKTSLVGWVTGAFYGVSITVVDVMYVFFLNS